MIRPFTARRLSLQMPWVGCRYPTQAQADEAGMTLEEFAEFFFSPVEGVVEFSEFPAAESGHECEDVRLVFTGGRVVEASARTDDGGKLFLDGELVQENGRWLS
jgi:leucyl aminopeptidase (aminopeptidase T)